MKIKSFFFLLPLLFFACNKNPKIEGYTLIEKRFVPEVNAECYYFEHDKTGAKVFKIAADDPNKTFCIGFCTPPEDDCGTPHILEHSVLNGSKNYPVKAPFDVLMKGSLNTFLNAMTSKVYTYYPAASMNEKDYFNLMHVYYDAVFNPLIYTRPEIFAQEGWHRELTSADDEIKYKGVVYNEMQGAFSRPTTELFNLACRTLFPGNPFEFVSGGYPDSIPNLTYEKFLNFHKNHYHPSNSYIFFYGDADMNDELTFIDTAYLSKYEKQDFDYKLTMHDPFDEMKETNAYYSVPEGADTVDQTYVALYFVIGDGTDRSLDMSLDVLTDVLINQESAPIRLALQKAGLGKNVSSWSYAMRQNFMQITIDNTNASDAEEIKQIIFNTLDSVAKAGLDKEAVEGVINRMEFNLREDNDANKGVSLVSRNISNWIYKGDPFAGIEYEKPLSEIKKALTTDMLEQIIQTALIDNPYKLLVTLKPKPGLENERNEHIRKELDDYKASLTKYEIDSLVSFTKTLLANQDKEDSPEALATIPVLSIKDIDPETDWYEVEEKDIDGNKVLHYSDFTNSILYIRYMFDLRTIPEELIPWASIYDELLGKLDTKNYTFEELEKTLKINTGSFGSSIVYYDNPITDELIPFFRISAKATIDKADTLFDLSNEVLFNTEFSDTARVKTVLTKLLANYESRIKRNGYGIAYQRLRSYISKIGVFKEEISGVDFYWFLRDLVNDFDNQYPTLIANIETLEQSLLTKNNLTIAIICSDDDFNKINDGIAEQIKSYPVKKLELNKWQLKPEVKNEGFLTASKVQFVVQGGNMYHFTDSYNGKFLVLKNIVTNDWLHKEIRVKGGAYGGFGNFGREGEVYFSSYRDPNLTETFDAIKKTGDFVKNYETDSVEFTRSIIGTIADLDYPMTVERKGNVALWRYYSGDTKAEEQQRRDDVLTASIDDIHALAPIVDSIVKQNIYCVYGNQELLEKNKDLFEATYTLP